MIAAGLHRSRGRGRAIAACLCAALAVACATSAAENDAALVLSFEEFEPGIGTSTSRVLITRDWLRIDEGAGDEGGYVLFERASGQLFSVSHTARTVLHMEPAEPAPAPGGLGLEIVRREPAQAPRIAGRAVTEVRLLAYGDECAGAHVASGYLEDARAVLLAYRRRLVASNQATLANTPEDLRTPCFLGDVHAGDFAYRQGFPVAWWDASGRRRVLTAVEPDMPVDAALWQLPSYRRFRIGG